MWDNGSTLSFVTYELAERLHLTGKRVNLSIITVGGQTAVVGSQQYFLDLIDKTGNKVEIEVFGINKISSSINKLNIEELANLFNINPSEINRPVSGEIDVLIGVEYSGYHPVRCDARGHLLLLQNRFGKTIAGSHSKLKEGTLLEDNCLMVRHARVMHIMESAERFYSVESLGVMCEPKCGACRCGKCHPGGKSMTLKEEKEHQLIESQLIFNSESGRWIAGYPWIRDPKDLKYNRHVAFAVLKSTERRIGHNENYAALYSRQINDMINRGAARKLEDAELQKYDGVKFYITHHAVMKPSSKSTPCRIVFNSSAKHCGISLNDCLAKGPCLLNILLGVLLRFRQNKFAFIGDISKMYHSIDIGLSDQMTHLFLWRNFDKNVDPSTYAITVVNMGDRPSAAIAQTALKKTAEKSRDTFPKASNIIVENAYMDDIPASVNSENEAIACMTEIDRILRDDGFHIKQWIFNGRNVNEGITSDQRNVQLLVGMNDTLENEDTIVNENVLGMQWDPNNDFIKFNPITLKNTENNITKRAVLSVVNGIFDPLGLLTPLTVRAKILLRKIWAHQTKLDWDDAIPKEMVNEWKSIIADLEQIPKLSFRRSLTPNDATGHPTLVIFQDGSGQAYGTVAYVRWEVMSGGFVSVLVMAKSRIAPLKIIDIVRLELCGGVLGSRLRSTLQKELRLSFKKVIHILDSEIVQAMLHLESYGYGTFAANRVGEIQQTTHPSEWCWVEGKPWLNIADLTTRGCKPGQLGLNSIWQNGPLFLALSEEQWPVRWEVKKGIQIPELKKSQQYVGIIHVEESLSNRIDVNRFSKWRHLVNTTARILNLYDKFKKDSNCTMDLTPGSIMKAEIFWIKEAQKGMSLNSLYKLLPVYENNIVVVGGRTERWMASTWNQQKFILLPKESRVSILIARHMHTEGGHLGISATISKIRSKYWIINVRMIVKDIVKNCRICKEKLKSFCNQKISPLPMERIKPSPAFSNIGLDYFGPFAIRGEVQKRVHGKCYGVIFVCLSSTAVHVDVANDYSTDGFLQVLRRFASIRGWPQKMFSDQGSQLVGASKELKDAISNLNWEELKLYGHNQGFEWSFSPGDAPWYNGLAESLVKSTKRALNTAIGDTIMRFSELQTCMYEAGQLVNQRPIGRHPTDPNEGAYLCPNDLLMGRGSPDIPQGPFKERSSHKFRFDFIQNVVSAFWKRWMREVFPNLVIEPKWHTESRNLRTGDVVIVQDVNAIRGKWRLALVKTVYQDDDGKVRHVIISYKTISGTEIAIERAVQRLILIVPVDDSEQKETGVFCNV